MERFFSRLIIVITLLTISTNLSAQTNIQRKFFDKLELGKYVSKKMIASSIGTPEYKIEEEKTFRGTEYTVDFNGYFGGQEWAKILIVAVNNKLAMISFWNFDTNDNKPIYDDILDKLTRKYGKPDDLAGYDTWNDNSTYTGITLFYVKPSSAGGNYYTILNYTDFKLYGTSQSKALDEL